MSGSILTHSGLISGITTAVLLVSFIGVAIWAYSGRRRASFDAAARLPLEEDANVIHANRGDEL